MQWAGARVSLDHAQSQAIATKNMADEVQHSLAHFWDEARLNAVISALLQHYFPLTVTYSCSICCCHTAHQSGPLMRRFIC
jgi:hypothetical protein